MLDNCSTDGTLEWLYSLREDRVIIHESATPLSIEANWSRIQYIDKNEFITLIGHDDILDYHYLETMNDLILKHPSASLYQAHFQYINEGGSVLRNCKPMDEVQYGHEFLAAFMCNMIDSTGTGYMMRSGDYDKLGGIDPSFENLIFADYTLWIDLTLMSYKATTSAMVFKYRIHNNLSKTTGAQLYQQAFEKFLTFIFARAQRNDKIKMITERYGKTMLMYYCESLSHRILKTPRNQRQIIVKDFIEKCKTYAAILIPNQDFNPAQNFRINIARILDNSGIGRNLFYLFKKLLS